MRISNVNGLILANIIVIGVAFAFFLPGQDIRLIHPYTGAVTDDRKPLFEWSSSGDGSELVIDDDEDFSTPYVFSVTGRSAVLSEELEYGTYWWKVRNGNVESEAGKFTVVSTVSLSRPEKGIVINSGNSELLFYRSGVTGAFVLGVNQTIEVGEEENVMAEQK